MKSFSLLKNWTETDSWFSDLYSLNYRIYGKQAKFKYICVFEKLSNLLALKQL